jgi:hypothetical protein
MADNKALAAEFKAKGNAALSAQNFAEAIENYTKVGSDGGVEKAAR